jgi:hypothetical protein
MIYKNNNNNYNNIFLDWFVGFSEGDGSFIIDKNCKKSFEIWQHISDIDVLNLICTNLNFGSIRKPPYRPHMAVFYINKQDELNKLYEIFENRVHTKNTKLRLGNSCAKDLIINKPSIDKAWLSGFIDAEGCFRIKYESTGSLKLIFEISQKEDSILLHIKELLNLSSKVRKCNNHWVLSIYSKSNRNTLIEYLNKYPLKSHKNMVFNKWKEANEIVNNGEHLTKYKEYIKELSINLNKWRKS